MKKSPISNDKKRVVVTGIGIISPMGVGVEEFWGNCLNGVTNITKIPAHWYNYHSFKSSIWSSLPEIDLQNHDVSPIETLRLDPVTQLAIAATSLALKNAGIEKDPINEKDNMFTLSDLDPIRMGVIYGTGVGGVSTLLAGHAYQAISGNKKKLNHIKQKPELNGVNGTIKEDLSNILNSFHIPKRYNPFIVSMIMPNACASNLSIKFGIKGLSQTVCAACASGTAALGQAYRAIQNGLIDTAVTGGAEYLRDDYGSIFRGFDILNALTKNPDLSPGGSRPFDLKRDGFLYCEGAGATLIFEELDHARQRGAQILGEIVGFAESNDANNIMIIEHSGEQITRMLTNMLTEAELSTSEIDYINAHGTGTEVNDEVEAKVISRLFGNSPLVNSTKSLLGHTIGASGAIEAIVSLLSIRDNTTHICNNLDSPIADLNFVTEIKERPINTVISQSFGFGGHNCALAIRGLHP